MENIDNQQGRIKSPVPTMAIPVLAPIRNKFENYDEKADYFQDINEQISLRLKQIKIAESLKAKSPTTSQKTYDKIIETNKEEIAILEQQKQDMSSIDTRH